MILREYIRIARVAHDCDNCFHRIEPGQKYRGEVLADGGKVDVFKFHYDPSCPDPDDEEFELAEIDLSDEMPMAA